MKPPVKRQKWSHLVVNSGHDRHTVPIFSACAGSRKVPLLKTLMSSYCQNDCKFCAFRCENNIKRQRWDPPELANVTMKLWKMGKIEGLFLSSSVERDPNTMVERQVETVRILRKNGFPAYVHLRLMPGVNRELIKQSVELADRVGINIEFPKSEYYNDMKIFLDFKQDLIRRIKWVSTEVKRAQKQGKCKAGLDSQIVVGASDELDQEIIEVSDWLYHELDARRVYYSSFEPMPNTPLEDKPAENRWREYRLYQCSFLIQKYGFRAKDFVVKDGMLPLGFDPKLLIARKAELIVDLNDASFEELIKVPGIGIKTAEKILEKRPIKRFPQLKSLGVLNRAQPFIELSGMRQTTLNSFRTKPNSFLRPKAFITH